MSLHTTKVGFRGPCGSLGQKLLKVCCQGKNFAPAFGIIRYDDTVLRFLKGLKFSSWARVVGATAVPLYLDGNTKALAELQALAGGFITIHPVSELDLSTCDVLVDTAPAHMSEELRKKLSDFQAPVLLQSGEYPRGRLIVPPYISPPQGGSRYRQGDCVLSGIAPVLKALPGQVRFVRMFVVRNEEKSGNSHLTPDRVNMFQIEDKDPVKIEAELPRLIGCPVSIASYLRFVAVPHYAITLQVTLTGRRSVEEVHECLKTVNRLRVLPTDVTSTYDLNLLRTLDEHLPPIMVLSAGTKAVTQGKRTEVTLVLAVHSGTIVVDSNLDSLYMIARGLSAEEAMAQTDKDLGFV